MIGSGLRPGAWSAFKTRFGVDHICELYAASDGNIGFTNVLNFDDTVGFSLMGWELVQYDHDRDRKSVVSGKSVSVRVDLGGRRTMKKKNKREKNNRYKRQERAHRKKQ